MLPGLTTWATDIVESLGYVGVALLVMIENVFPPIPSEVILTLAGFVASRGDATVPGMIAASTVGSVSGAWILYGAARWFGAERLRAIVLRYGRWLRVTGRDIDRAEAAFDRWSSLAVLLCRFIPLVRSLISIPAGLRRMPFIPFTIYTAIGSGAWNTIFVLAGYLLGERWEDVLAYADVFEKVMLGTLALATVFLAWRFWSRRRPVRSG